MSNLRVASRITLAAAVLTGSAFAAQAVEILSDPILTMNPNGTTPLAGVVELETDVPVLITLMITDGLDLWTVQFPEAQQVHYLPVLGLKPDRTYSVSVEMTPGGSAGTLDASTGPLPVDFPVLTTLVSIPGAMEPGLTLIDCFRRLATDTRSRYSIVVDGEGDVVWYSTICATAMRQLVNGELFFRIGSSAIETDMLGNESRSVSLQDPGLVLHHDLLRTPMGTLLSLTREAVGVRDYPTSDTDPNAPTQTASIEDDPVVEFFPDGTLRQRWRLVEMLDPTRIGYDSLNSVATGIDWAHANAVNYDPTDDSIIVSVRHQDAVVKFSRQTGEILWILGPHDNWSSAFEPFLLDPVGAPFRWQYHQHAPMVTGEDRLMLFDNGNNRASPFDGKPRIPGAENFSRGVEYEIDGEAMEVRQVWEYGELIQESLYSGLISDADRLQTTGNVLMTFGAVSFSGGSSSSSLGLGSRHVRIIEVTDDAIPQKVFDLRLHDAAGRIQVFRSERIPSLYPQQYVKSPNGVGNTLLLGRNADSTQVTWSSSPVDAAHGAPDYYAVYASDAPDGGFSIVDTSIPQSMTVFDSGATQFYKVVAINTAGTSGDEP